MQDKNCDRALLVVELFLHRTFTHRLQNGGEVAKDFRLAKPIPQLSCEWKQYGSCKEYDRRIFFSELHQTIQQAVLVCNGCKVRKECLDYAIANNEHGVWGGKTERQRRLMIRRINYESKKIAGYGPTIK